MTRNRIFLLAAVICCIALLAAGTSAFFTLEETAYNVITMGNLVMRLHDETDAEIAGGQPGDDALPEGERVPFPKDGLTGVMPGVTVPKYVYLENTGSEPFYARIRLTCSVVSAQGEPLAFDPDIRLVLNDEGWTKSGDWYYCDSAVEPDTVTADLLQAVAFSGALPNSYMDCRVVVEVDAQAVQAKNNGDSAVDAAGWPLDDQI